MLCPQWCVWGYQEKCKACGKVWVETHQTSSKAVYNAFNNYDENATLTMFSFFPLPVHTLKMPMTLILLQND